MVKFIWNFQLNIIINIVFQERNYNFLIEILEQVKNRQKFVKMSNIFINIFILNYILINNCIYIFKIYIQPQIFNEMFQNIISSK